jgi:hypothetical protein
MIFGVPLGSQTIHVDVDLSDIGEFSLAPQDLIRNGIATENQVAGNKFRKSTNLNELPQIVSFNRTLEVVPLWGQPEVCSLGITRTDFDLATEANVTITPTAIFMGSIFSTNDKDYQRRNCKPKSKQGELCNLVAGPGEILAIRQTIFEDEVGRPILETYDLESGGQVIDENGAWLVDVPMNLDYVITNEFGERVLSNDPKKGIPTKAKYRFKIKWNQSPKLSETVKRGYFLVPNVREYGWTNVGVDPRSYYEPTNPNYESYLAFIKSYAFSVDWNDYGLTGTTIGEEMIQSAINCEDKFYPMIFNKVYSVSQLIDQYRNGYLPDRIISVKNILDDTCESDNVRFPTNDTVYRFDLLYLLFIILIFIARPILNIFLIVAHLVAYILQQLGIPDWRRIANMEVPNLTYPECDLCECQEGKRALGPGPTAAELAFDVNLGLSAYISPLTQFSYWDGPITQGLFGIQQLLSGNNTLGLNYGSPQLETVFTDGPGNSTGKGFTNSLPLYERINLFNVKAKYFDQLNQFVNPGGGYNRIKVNFAPTENGYYGETFYNQYNTEKLGVLVSGGTTFNNPDPNTYSILNPIPFQNQLAQPTSSLVLNPWNSGSNTYVVPENGTYTITLTVNASSYTSGQKNFHLVINGTTQAAPFITLFPASSVPQGYTLSTTINLNLGNTIAVELQQKGLPANMTYTYQLQISGRPFGYGNSNERYHLDNVMMLMVKPDKITELRPGTILSFQNPELSSDVNVTGYTIVNQFGSTSSTGTTKNTTSGILVPYANPNGSGNWFGPGFPGGQGQSFYQVTQNNVINEHKFAIDIEYFQVITAMTVNDYISVLPPNNLSDSLNSRVINGHSLIHVVNTSDCCYNTNFCVWPQDTITLRNFREWSEQVIVFMVRGVDPYSDRIEIEYDLSRLFGYPLDNQGRPNGPVIVRGSNYKMNIPIQGRYKSVKHYANSTNGVDPNTNQFLYYPSYRFRDSTTGSARYTGFTSNLPAYYSSLDETTPTNFFTGANLLRDTLDTGTANVYGGSGYLKVIGAPIKQNGLNVNDERNLRNVFQVTLSRRDAVPCRWFTSQNNEISTLGGSPISQNVAAPTASAQCNPGGLGVNVQFYKNTGYFPNEIVDGGSYMSGEMDKERNLGIFSPNRQELSFKTWYYSPTYDDTQRMGYQFNAIDDRIVMRSDRLPTSTNTFRNGANSYAWQANISLSVYIISDDGTFFNGTGSPVGSPSFASISQSIEENNLNIQALNTFDCQSLVPLSCYYVPNGATEIAVRPTGNNCYTNGVSSDRQLIMQGGCYVFITTPFKSLDKDLTLLWEWTSRIQINFAACRNVFSHIFTNNWINGSLFAFSIQNSRFFDSNNQPFSVYCYDTMILDPNTNNFYYRSSPFTNINVTPPAPNSPVRVGVFRGSPKPSAPSIFGISLPSYKGNNRNLKFPTTMIDLGPRSQYLQELVYSNQFDGFMVNRLKETSYQDVSEILNVFIINRITNKRVLDRFLNRTAINVRLFFDNNRDNLFVDGDYAQMISINSELGVYEFNAINYPPVGGPNDQDPLFFNNPNARDPVFGIFFSSETQTRDFVSPRRTILNPNLPILGNNNCSFDSIGTFSQEVPFYQWQIQENSEGLGESIFGSERNDWFTQFIEQYVNDDPNYPYLSYFKYNYQSLDRLFKYSRYYRPSGFGNPLNGDFKGFIYSIDRNQPTPEYETTYRLQNPPNDYEARVFQVGAPFFFYFGLKKGKTAWDKFSKKWLDFNNIVE